MTGLSRRNFLGILGTSLVAAYVPAWTLDLAPKGVVAPFSFSGGLTIWDLSLLWSDGDRPPQPRYVTIGRDGTVDPLLQFGMSSGSTLRWVAVPEHEIVVPQNQALWIDPPDERLHWTVIGKTKAGIACMARGHGDTTDEVCTLEDLANLGARARRRRQRWLTTPGR